MPSVCQQPKPVSLQRRAASLRQAVLTDDPIGALMDLRAVEEDHPAAPGAVAAALAAYSAFRCACLEAAAAMAARQ